MFSHLNQIFTCYKYILYLTYHERVWSSVFLGSYFFKWRLPISLAVAFKTMISSPPNPPNFQGVWFNRTAPKRCTDFRWLGLFGNMILVSIRVFPPTNMQSTVDLVISLDCLVSYVFSWYKSLIPLHYNLHRVIPGKPKRSRFSISSRLVKRWDQSF